MGRLILRYERVGNFTKADYSRRGVVGVVSADFLETNNNKQAFEVRGRGALPLPRPGHPKGLRSLRLERMSVDGT